MVLLDRRHQLDALCDLQKEGSNVWAETSLLVRCVTRHDGRPIGEMEAVKKRNPANKVIRTVNRYSSFILIVKLVVNFGTALKRV